MVGKEVKNIWLCSSTLSPLNTSGNEARNIWLCSSTLSSSNISNTLNVWQWSYENMDLPLHFSPWTSQTSGKEDLSVALPGRAIFGTRRGVRTSWRSRGWPPAHQLGRRGPPASPTWSSGPEADQCWGRERDWPPAPMAWAGCRSGCQTHTTLKHREDRNENLDILKQLTSNWDLNEGVMFYTDWDLNENFDILKWLKLEWKLWYSKLIGTWMKTLDILNRQGPFTEDITS